MKINNFTNLINPNYNKINKYIESIANPSNVKKSVNKILDDMLNIEKNTSLEEIQNFNEAIGFMQIADGALNSISDNLNKIKILQVSLNNSALNNDNISAINSEIEKYAKNINEILNNTTYNDKNVFGNFNFNGINVNTSLPNFSLDNIDDFEKALNSARSSIGSFNKEAVSKIKNLSTYVTNISAAQSQNEVDISEAINNFNKEKLKINVSSLLQAHSINISEQNLLNLLS